MSTQVSYQPSHRIHMKPSEPILIKSSLCISMKKDKSFSASKPAYSLCNKLFDPEASPPNSDFMKRLHLRNVHYNMSEKSPNPPIT
jgi:hypothetical protein